MAVDRRETLLPKIGEKSAVYRPLPLLELLGVSTDYCEMPLDTKAVLWHGYLLPPPEFSAQELDLVRKLAIELQGDKRFYTFISGYLDENSSTGCWNRFLSADHDHYPESAGKLAGKRRARYPQYGGKTAQICSRDFFYGDLIEGDKAFQDHLCSHHACSNPRHLEQVAIAVNNRRAQRKRLEGQESVLGGGVYSPMPQLISFYDVIDLGGVEAFKIHDDGLDGELRAATRHKYGSRKAPIEPAQQELAPPNQLF